MPLEQDNHSAETASRPVQSRFRSSLLALGLAGSLGVTALATAGCQQRDPVTAMGKSFEDGGKEKAIRLDIEKMKGQVGADKQQSCANLVAKLGEVEKGAKVDAEGNPLEGDQTKTVGGLGAEHSEKVLRAEVEKLCMEAAGGKAASTAPSASPTATVKPAPTTPAPSSTVIPPPPK